MPKEVAPIREDTEKEYNERIYNRKRLEENESVVYRMLDQALKEDEISHAYLFSGPEGCLKKEAGILFAQSIILEKNSLVHEEDLNDEEKNIASRIVTGNYADFIFLDGYRKEAISKDEISEIQSLFSKTSSEKSNRKFYLIDHFENMSISAMNAILKFLEEPEENVYAVLTTDNIDRLLPTVISRCVLVPFHPLKKSTCYAQAISEGLDEEDAFLLTRIISKTSDYMSLAVSQAYQNAKSMLKQYIGIQGNPRLILVDYDVRYKLQAKDTDGSAKDQNIDQIKLFLMLLSKFYRDGLTSVENAPSWYMHALEEEKKNHTHEQRIALIDIAQKELNRCNRTNDLNLLLDQAIYEMEEVKYGRNYPRN